MQDSLYQTEQALDQFLRNFPNRPVAGLLRIVLFPMGLGRQKPTDKLDHKVARILQTPCESRSRLGRGQFLEAVENNAVGMMEQALKDILAAEPIYDRVCQAAGKKYPFMQLDKLADTGLSLNAINEQEADLLRKAEVGRLRTINVDDFDPQELAAAPLQADKPMGNAA